MNDEPLLSFLDEPKTAPVSVPLWWPGDDMPAAERPAAPASTTRRARRWVTAGVAALAVAALCVVGINAVASKATAIDAGGAIFGGRRGGFPGGVAPPGGRQNPGGGTTGRVTSITNGIIEIVAGTRTIRVVTTAATRVVEQQPIGPVTKALTDIHVGTNIDVTGVRSANGAVDAQSIVILA